MGDYPDGTLPVTVLLKAELMSQVRNLPWWVRYAPSRILYLDDMEGVLKWGELAGTVAKATDINVYEGTYALKLTTPAESEGEANSGITLGFSGLSKIMLQLVWNVIASEPTDFGYADFIINIESGTDALVAALRYLHYDTAYQRKWQYYDEDGNWQDITGGSQYLNFGALCHHTLMFTIDPTAAVREYVRLRADNLNVSLADLKPYYATGVSAPNIAISFDVVNASNASLSMYIDALCLSDNEE